MHIVITIINAHMYTTNVFFPAVFKQGCIERKMKAKATYILYKA